MADLTYVVTVRPAPDGAGFRAFCHDAARNDPPSIGAGATIPAAILSAVISTRVQEIPSPAASGT